MVVSVKPYIIIYIWPKGTRPATRQGAPLVGLKRHIKLVYNKMPYTDILSDRTILHHSGHYPGMSSAKECF